MLRAGLQVELACPRVLRERKQLAQLGVTQRHHFDRMERAVPRPRQRQHQHLLHVAQHFGVVALAQPVEHQRQVAGRPRSADCAALGDQVLAKLPTHPREAFDQAALQPRQSAGQYEQTPVTQMALWPGLDDDGKRRLVKVRAMPTPSSVQTR